MPICDTIFSSSMGSCVDSPGNRTNKGKHNMAEAEKNGCERGCTSGCDCGGKANNADTSRTANVAPGDDVRFSYGKTVASAAIEEMHSESDKESETCRRCVDPAEVKAFIEECGKSGEDVAKVVGHIAEREGIDLTAGEPKEQHKAALWTFLLEVLKTWVMDIAQFAAQEIAAGHFDWKSFLWDYVSDKLGGKKQEGYEVREENAGKVSDKAVSAKAQDDVPSWVMALRPIMLVPSRFPMVIHRYVVVR